jgi:hypothetical protein
MDSAVPAVVLNFGSPACTELGEDVPGEQAATASDSDPARIDHLRLRVIGMA